MSAEIELRDGEIIFEDPTRDTINLWTSLLQDTKRNIGKVQCEGNLEVKLFGHTSHPNKNHKQNKKDVKKRIKSLLENCPFPSTHTKKAIESYTENPENMNLDIDRVDPKSCLLLDIDTEGWISALDLEKKGLLQNIEDAEFDWDKFKQYRDLNSMNEYQKELDEWMLNDQATNKKKVNKPLARNMPKDHSRSQDHEKPNQIKENENCFDQNNNTPKVNLLQQEKGKSTEKIRNEEEEYQVKKKEKEKPHFEPDPRKRRKLPLNSSSNEESQRTSITPNKPQDSNNECLEKVPRANTEANLSRNDFVQKSQVEKSSKNQNVYARTEYKSNYKDDYVVTFSFFGADKANSKKSHPQKENLNPSSEPKVSQSASYTKNNAETFKNGFSQKVSVKEKQMQQEDFIERSENLNPKYSSQTSLSAKQANKIQENGTSPQIGEFSPIKPSIQPESVPTQNLKSILIKRALPNQQLIKYDQVKKKVKFAQDTLDQGSKIHKQSIKESQMIILEDEEVCTISDDDEEVETNFANENNKVIFTEKSQQNIFPVKESPQKNENEKMGDHQNEILKGLGTLLQYQMNPDQLKAAFTSLSQILMNNPLKSKELLELFKNQYEIEANYHTHKHLQQHYQNNQPFPTQILSNQGERNWQYPPYNNFHPPQRKMNNLAVGQNGPQFYQNQRHGPFYNDPSFPKVRFPLGQAMPQPPHFSYTTNNTNNVFIEKVDMKGNFGKTNNLSYNNFQHPSKSHYNSMQYPSPPNYPHPHGQKLHDNGYRHMNQAKACENKPHTVSNEIENQEEDHEVIVV